MSKMHCRVSNQASRSLGKAKLRKHITALLVASVAFASAADAKDAGTDAALLRDRALAGNVAYSVVEDMTTDIGARLAATPAERHARDWIAARMVSLGFAHVHVQTFAVPHWERGVESADVVGVSAQKLVLTALGQSGATPIQGIEAEVVQFADLDALAASPAEGLKGKIVFVDHAMARAQDWSIYAAFGVIRRDGPAIAASKGAAGFLMRSLGTGTARVAHTGVTVWPDGTKPIAAAALAVTDAQQLARLLARGPVRLRLVLTPKFYAPGTSGNVVGEITGAAAPREIVAVGDHIDSWDLGTGALDDAAGVAITVAAAKTIIDAINDGSVARPRRTIRIIAFGDEETAGALGGATYLSAHSGDIHVLTAESDLGGDRVWQLRANVGPSAAPAIKTLAKVLAPLGIAPSSSPAYGGTDVDAIGKAGAGVLDLAQDASRYFDFHHSADDTLDKIDPAQLDQNVAAWTAMLWVAANSDTDFRQSKDNSANKPK